MGRELGMRKKLVVLALIVVSLLAIAGLANAEHGNIGGVGVTSVRFGVATTVWRW